MSAVDDVAGRIRRLEESCAAKSAHLRQLQHELRYNVSTGVDERLADGQSVARLELRVEGGRNLLFKAGFLSGQRSYVRVTVEVITTVCEQSGEQLRSTTVMEHRSTGKRPVSYTPHWSEPLLFEGLPAAVGTLRVDVMQEERIGADEVVGTVLLPLARLQDQRPVEKWHVLKKHDKTTIGELLFSCRFQRSPISALELELELLQNQASELHLFLCRHQNLVGLPTPEPTRARRGTKPLQGKEVVPEQTPERTASTRFSAVASFPPAMRKREVENVSMNVEMQETPRAKRQRVADTEKQVNSLSDRIANWLLPAAVASAPTNSVPAMKEAPQSGAFAEESTGMSSSQFFPFKQRQTAPAPRRPRRPGRPLSATPQKPASALQTIEKWLFTDKDGKPRELPFGRPAPSY